MTAEEKQKLAALLGKQHVAVLITRGEQWPTGTLQAFAETDSLEILFIMGENAEKYQNLQKHPQATVVVDNRDVGNVPTFDVARASLQGVAEQVQREGAEWERLRELFLKKNPFEAPFFGNPALRMMRIKPTRVSYSNGLKDSFKATFE
jgi:general stress protein 26